MIRALNRDILEQMEPTIKAIAGLIRVHRAKAALIDLWDVPGEATFMHRYGLGEQTGCHPPRILIATLLLGPLADSERIGQLVTQNRGVHVEIFTDSITTEAWFDQQTRPT